MVGACSLIILSLAVLRLPPAAERSLCGHKATAARKRGDLRPSDCPCVYLDHRMRPRAAPESASFLLIGHDDAVRSRSLDLNGSGSSATAKKRACDGLGRRAGLRSQLTPHLPHTQCNAAHTFQSICTHPRAQAAASVVVS